MGGNDYSADCERTGLGRLLYCGLLKELPQDDNNIAEKIRNQSGEVYTVINGQKRDCSKRSNGEWWVDAAGGGYYVIRTVASGDAVYFDRIGYKKTADSEETPYTGDAHLALYFSEEIIDS